MGDLEELKCIYRESNPGRHVAGEHSTTEPSMLTLICNPCRKKKFPDENLLLIETVFYLGREYIKSNEDS